MASPFTNWLRDQADRDDPIGDLARDSLRHGSQWPANGSELKEFVSVIQGKLYDTSGALNALYEAWAEWSGEEVSLPDNDEGASN